VKNLILISNPLIVKGDEEFGKRKGLFQVPSFSDPLGARTQDPNIKSVVLSRHLKAFACGSTFKCNLLSKRILTINQ
jgi:hypothetical protein